MSHRLIIATSLALPLLAGSVRAESDQQSVGISVGGTVVEVPVELATQACGINAETLIAQWDQRNIQIATWPTPQWRPMPRIWLPSPRPTISGRHTGLAVARPGRIPVRKPETTLPRPKDLRTIPPPQIRRQPQRVGPPKGGHGAVVAAASPQASAAENPRNATSEGAASTEDTPPVQGGDV